MGQSNLTPEQIQKLKAAGASTNMQEVLSTNDNIINNRSNTSDPYGRIKATEYPSENLGYRTYYNKLAYKRLGFDPFSDNYEKYATKSTNGELFFDALAAHSAMHNNMFSYFGMGGMNTKESVSDQTYRELIDRGTPIGRNDTYSWALQQFTQAGYTTSLISSIAAEELTMAAATALTDGATAEAAWAKTAQNFKRILNVGDKLGDLNKVRQGLNAGENAEKLRSTLDHIGDLQSFEKAQTFWSKAKTFAGNKAKDMFAPTAHYINSIQKGDYVLNGFAALTGGASAFWREMRNFKMAFDEAGLERSGAENDIMKKLTDAYYSKNGKAPEGEDLKKIQSIASQAGQDVYSKNVGLLYLTNHIGFDGLYAKLAPRVFSESVVDSTIGKLFLNKGNAKKGVGPSAEFVKNTFKDKAKYYFKPSTLKKAPLRTAKYLSGSIIMGANEGIQEYFQEVIQDAEGKKAEDKYLKGIEGDSYRYYLDSMNKYISPEGADIFLSGFTMGAFAGPHRVAVEQASNALGKAGSYLSGNYKTQKNNRIEQQKKYEEDVKNINEMFSKPWSEDVGFGSLADYKQAHKNNEKLDEASKTKNEKNFKDVKDDNTVDRVLGSIQNSSYDHMIDYLKQIGNLSDEDLKKGFKDVLGKNNSVEDINTFRKNTKDIIDRAENIKNIKKLTDEKFVNPYKFGNPDNDNTFGYNEHIMWKSYELAKRDIIKNQYSLLRTLERQNGIQKDLQSDLPYWDKAQNIDANKLSVLTDDSGRKTELELLEKEITNLNNIPESERSYQDKKDLEEKTKLYTHLKEFNDTADSLSEAYKFESVLHQTKQQVLDETPIERNSEVEFIKSNSTGKVLDEKDNKYKIQKSNGWIGWVNKTSVRKKEVKADVDNTLSNEVVNELWNKYKNYMTHVGGETFDDEKGKKSFSKLLDFFALKQDSKNLSHSLNLLLNPGNFEKNLQRNAAIQEHLWKNKKQNIKDALEQSYKNQDNKTLIDTLKSKYNAFLLEEDLEKLFENAEEYKLQLEGLEDAKKEAYFYHVVMSEDVYDISSHKPIDKASKRYIDISNEILEYIENRWERKDETTSPETSSENKDNSTKESTDTSTNKENKELKPISLDTPFKEWPQELQDQAITIWQKINKDFQDAVDNGESEKAHLITNSIEEFINSQIGKINLNQLIKDYNSKIKPTKNKIEDVSDEEYNNEIKPETESTEINDNEESNDKTTSNVNESKEDEEVEVSTMHNDLNDLEDYTEDNSIPNIDYTLNPVIEDRILNNEVTLIALPINPKTNELLEKELRKQSLLKANEHLSDEHIGMTFKVNINNKEIIFIYTGKKSVNELESGVQGAIDGLGLSNNKNDIYKFPITIDGNIYYTASEAEALWLDGKGKQQTFKVIGKNKEINRNDLTNEDLINDKWISTLYDRMKEAKDLVELDRIIDKILEESTLRAIDGKSFVEMEDLQEMFDEIKTSILRGEPTKNIININVGESYDLKGKLFNFGPALVVSKTDKTITLQSYKTKEEKEVKLSEIEQFIKEKINDMDERISSQLVELDKNEKEVVSTNLKNIDEFEKDKNAIINFINSLNLDSVDDDFINNLGC